MRVSRLVDIAVAGAGLLLLSPVMAVIACALLLGEGKPIFFRQARVTKGGRIFQVIKFRTMNDGRDAQGFLLPDVIRTTALGGLLRRLRLDELPQLWNVLTGSMALIGPRPLLPGTILDAGESGRRRCSVAPGLTGWAQVNGNSLLSDSDKIALDLWYIANRSALLDLTIVLRTAWVALRGERFNPVSIGRAHESNTRRRG